MVEANTSKPYSEVGTINAHCPSTSSMLTELLPSRATFWEHVHPVSMIELLKYVVHALLIDTISCRENKWD